MKFIERRRQVRADKHKRNLEEQSKDPAGNGWLYDPEDPNVLLILGDTINVADPKGYSLANLERKYAALKRQLAQRYPDFTPGAIKLEVELWHAAVLLADPTLRADLTPLVRTFRSMDCFVPARREITALHTISQMGGDEIDLQIVRCSYFEGYGFFVYGHPDSAGQGLWCRDQPDLLAAISDERTL